MLNDEASSLSQCVSFSLQFIFTLYSSLFVVRSFLHSICGTSKQPLPTLSEGSKSKPIDATSRRSTRIRSSGKALWHALIHSCCICDFREVPVDLLPSVYCFIVSFARFAGRVFRPTAQLVNCAQAESLPKLKLMASTGSSRRLRRRRDVKADFRLRQYKRSCTCRCQCVCVCGSVWVSERWLCYKYLR